MALTFKDLTIGEIYPIYVIKGNKVETKRIKPTNGIIDGRDQGRLLCLFVDKLGRQTHDWWGDSCQFSIWHSDDMKKSSVNNVYFLNKEEALRCIIAKLKKQKQDINKKIMDVFREFNIDKNVYFDE
jgi:hypothetical protein